MKSKPTKTVQINFDLSYNGEWYDGRTWSDGVPYMEGSLDVTCGKKTDTKDYNNVEICDVLWDGFRIAASFLTRGVNKIDSLSEAINDAYELAVDDGSVYAYHLNGMTVTVDGDNFTFDFQIMSDEEIEELNSTAPEDEDEDEED